MYTSFYRLRGRPFQLTPDHRFFFEGQPHRRAIAYLTYGLSQGEGFVVITGDVGTGKTILMEHLFSKLQEERFVTGKVVTTQVDSDNLLRMVAAAFGVKHEGDDKATVLKRVETFLVDSYRSDTRALLVIDEAQHLSDGSLEELRMLSNYQVGGFPLLQTFLLGQTHFRRTIAGAGLEQLRQRVIASHHLQPLGREETRKYIEHRLRLVGWQNDPAFAVGAFDMIYEETGGVARRINLLWDRLLLFGFVEERHGIDESVIKDVIMDMRRENLPSSSTACSTAVHSAGGAPSSASETTASASDLDRLAERVTVLERHIKAQ